MKLFKEIEMLERLHLLISRKATGTPAELAERFNMSKRNVLRILESMKARGFPVAYDNFRQTYYYDGEVTFDLKITFINGEEVIRIKGGENFSDFEDFFSRVTDSVTGRGFLCGSGLISH
jgi:hypothetical protein